MENHIICAMRTQDGVGCAPEYANDHLKVNIHFAQSLTDIRELSVRFYSRNYCLVGADSKTMSPQKRVRRCNFDILSAEDWRIGFYYVYVFRNGYPRWYAEMYIEDNEFCNTNKVRLTNLEDVPVKQFFAEKLCCQQWWPTFEGFKLKEDAVCEFIEQLFQITSNKGKAILRASSGMYFITSIQKEVRTFAASTLESYLKDNKDACCYHLFLSQYQADEVKWDEIKDCIKESRITTIEISWIQQNDWTTVHLLKTLSMLIQCKAFPDTTFIFQGTPVAIEKLQEECSLFAKYVKRYPVLQLLPDPCQMAWMEYDEFEKLLDEFVNSTPQEDVENQEQHEARQETCTQQPEEEKKTSAEQSLSEMIGLQRVKNEIQDARMMAMFIRERRALNLDLSNENRNHMLFLGNPGTGKTTVASLIGEIYHNMGLLSRGHTVTKNRSQLMGEYIGQTEQKTLEAIEQARGGILFIDEAYTLISKNDSKDFGKEIINALLTVLSEPNPDMIVILAGYEDKLLDMLKFNEGLKDRFPLQFHFEDYTANELHEIALSICKSRSFKLTPEADSHLCQIIEKAVLEKDKYFGNGRWVHNLIEHGIIKCMARRVMSAPYGSWNPRLFCVIEESDIAEAEKLLLLNKPIKMQQPRRIGFTA